MDPTSIREKARRRILSAPPYKIAIKTKFRKLSKVCSTSEIFEVETYESRDKQAEKGRQKKESELTESNERERNW